MVLTGVFAAEVGLTSGESETFGKHIISTMLQSFVALGVISVIWVLVGFSLCFGESLGGVVGDPRTFLAFRGVGLSPNADFAGTIPFLLFALFQLKFAIITPALITGSMAGRVRFRAYILFMVLFALIIYPPLCHMTWHPDGLLRQWGVLDFAGAPWFTCPRGARRWRGPCSSAAAWKGR